MRGPNFLIIGVPKGGTTSLYYYLQQHPEIEFAAHKEPHYFSYGKINFQDLQNDPGWMRMQKSVVKSEEDYMALFQGLSASFIGEASTSYFHNIAAAEKIAAFNPGMKMIVMLRDPVERLYSDWKHNVKFRYETRRNFSRALSHCKRRGASLPYLDYLNKGNYASHLKRYYKLFSRQNIQVCFYKDFIKDASRVCNDILAFLGIDQEWNFQTERVHNQNSFTVKNRFVYKVATRLDTLAPAFSEKIHTANTVPHAIDPVSRKYFVNFYKSEIAELEKLVDRDLGDWLV